MTEQEANANIGRNEPCPCGSGKKYKRCCGVSAAPKLSAPKLPAEGAGPATGGMGPMGTAGMPAGFDPSQMDPQAMMQVSQMLQRLPRGQLQRLQAIMQKAMAGKDVSKEAAQFEKSLPAGFKEMIQGMNLPGMPAPGASDAEAAAMAPAEAPPMTEEEARALVANAASEGKISTDEAEKLLGESVPAQEKASGFAKLWRGMTGKKS